MAARTDPMPGGTDLLWDFTHVSIRDGVVAFASRRDNQFRPPLDAGIYTTAGGMLNPVATFSRDYAAEAPTAFPLAAAGRWFDGSDVVFGIQNGQWGAIVRAMPVPEPGAA